MLCGNVYHCARSNLAPVRSLLACPIRAVMRSTEQLFPTYLPQTITDVTHSKRLSLFCGFSKLKKRFQYVCITLVRRILSFLLGGSRPTKARAVITSLRVRTNLGCSCGG